MKDKAVFACPLGHRLNSGVADGEVDHDDDAAEFFGEFCSFVHVFHCCSSDVHVVAFDLAGFGTGTVDSFHTVEEAITPAHEGLGVDVLVILDKIQTAAQSLVDDATVIASGEAQFGFGCRTE